MERYFRGKTVLVTGVGWGVGAATALLYAAYGAKVIISDTCGKEGKNTVAKIKSKKGDATFIKSDLSSPSECDKLIKRAIETYGSIDIACNNSGILSERGHHADKDMKVVNNEMSLNLNSLFYCMKYEIEAMQKQGGGVIMNMAFVLGPTGLASLSPYVAAKYGIDELMIDTPEEYSARGIRINAVTPAFINRALFQGKILTEKGALVKLFPMHSISKVEKVARLVVWLSSDKAPFVLQSDRSSTVQWKYEQN